MSHRSDVSDWLSETALVALDVEGESVVPDGPGVALSPRSLLQPVSIEALAAAPNDVRKWRRRMAGLGLESEWFSIAKSFLN